MKNNLMKIYFPILFIFLFNCSFAVKDRAPIFLEAQAISKTRQLNALVTTIEEKYWIVNITLRNDGQSSFPVDVAKFSLLGSDGYATNFSDIREIPQNTLFSSVTILPRETISGSLGFKLRSKEAYPVAIIYETTFLVATGKVYLVNPTPVTRTPVREESPYNSRRIVPMAAPTPSPQQLEEERVKAKAAKEAAAARDNSRAEAELTIVNKYIKLQDDNKKDYEQKKITFDQFMEKKQSLDRQKQTEILESAQMGEQVYKDTYTKVTADYYRNKK